MSEHILTDLGIDLTEPEKPKPQISPRGIGAGLIGKLLMSLLISAVVALLANLIPFSVIAFFMAKASMQFHCGSSESYSPEPVIEFAEPSECP
jgi:hypothetical protein